MRKNEITVVLGTAHRLREPGKTSPDGRLRECVYSREIVRELASRLIKMGYQTVIDYDPLDLPSNMKSDNYLNERSRELKMRVRTVNGICREKKNVLYVSIHVNAIGKDGQWHMAKGWQVQVGTKASAKSKLLAGCLFDAAVSLGLQTRQPLPKQKYWQQKLTVLNDTACPAVLTENLFQDNVDDVEYLLSDKGRNGIVQLHIDGITKYIEQI